MPKIPISTPQAPAALGPYSQAVRAGDLVFASGQIGLDPAAGQLVHGGVEAETTQAMKNLSAVLTAAGATWGDVVKTTIFLADLNDFNAVNKVYGGVVGTPAPARSTVQVAGLPRMARVEIEVIAHVGKQS
jgi:2-iminobutanoate/2-iminopropanoate deaminase